MRKELSLINKCKSWKECNQQIAKLTTGKQAKLGGNIFEHVVKLYLQTEPKYQTKFKQVWLLDEVPYKVKKLLRLPQADEGIDLVVKTNDGEYWSVQAKYRSNIDETLVFAGKGGLSTFQSLSFVTCKNISHGLICATVNKPPVKKHLLKNIGFEVADTWLSLDENNCTGWKRIQAKAKGKKLIVKPATPRPHQRNAIKEAKKHFLTSKNTRGKMIMPCGTGKSLASFWITHELKAKNIIVAVPSIALIKQTLNTWATESILNKLKIDWLCVCSDESVDNDQDEIISNTSDLGIKPTTNQKEIEKFLKHKTKNLKVIFTTYQSGTVTAKAARKIKTSFDLGLFDEAHKTVGHKDKQMAHLIFEKNIKIKKRLFMTATERLFSLNSTEYLSMDNRDNYGQIFYQLSFKKAIDAKPPIISDYKVITIGIYEEEIKKLIQKNKFLKIGKKIDNITARELAVGLALRKAIKKYNIKNTLTFHSSIRRANNFSSQQEIISELYPKFGKLDSFHVHGRMNTSERSLLLKEFGKSSKSLMTNARCLTEGVDLPSIDCVCFTDPKKSKTDIVQAAGRALRLSKGKKFGYIMVPIFVPDNLNPSDVSKDSAFEEVISVIGALSTQDSRIKEYLKAITLGKKPVIGKRIEGIISIDNLTKIDHQKFNKSIYIKVWKKIASANLMSFNEAKQFVRKNKIKSRYALNIFKKNNISAINIPSAPETFYVNEWKGIFDFYGINREYATYEEAKKFVKKNKIKSLDQLLKFKSNNNMHINIPGAHTTFKKYYKQEWRGSRDFFDNEWMPFEEAKKYVRKNNITSEMSLRKFRKKNIIPDDLPSNPSTAYKTQWMGTKDFFNTSIMSYNNAKKFLKDKKITSAKDYKKYISTHDINLPSHANSVYKKVWKGWDKFLSYNKNLSYEEIKKIVRNKNINSKSEFEKFIKNNKNINIPISLETVFKTQWRGWEIFLGKNKKYMTYEEAKRFVKKNNIQNETEFRKLRKDYKSSKKLPSSPDRFYINVWKGWSHFFDNEFISYDEAKKIVQKYNIKSARELKNFKKNNNAAKNIPLSANAVYKKDWRGWREFFGTVGKVYGVAALKYTYVSYTEAKKIIKKQNIKNRKEYREFKKLSKHNLPANPDVIYKSTWQGWKEFLSIIK